MLTYLVISSKERSEVEKKKNIHKLRKARAKKTRKGGNAKKRTIH